MCYTNKLPSRTIYSIRIYIKFSPLYQTQYINVDQRKFVKVRNNLVQIVKICNNSETFSLRFDMTAL